jgi:hypothetical protein
MVASPTKKTSASAISGGEDSHDISQYWVPPLSQQRRTVLGMQSGHLEETKELFFPFELTVIDYRKRIFDILVATIRAPIKKISVANQSPEGPLFPMGKDDFDVKILLEHMLGLDRPDLQSDDQRNDCKIVFIRANPLFSQPGFHRSIITILRSRYDFFKHDAHQEEGVLKSMDPLFKAAKEILITFGSNKHALQNLHHLDAQMKLHNKYKETRLKTFGWSLRLANEQNAPGRRASVVGGKLEDQHLADEVMELCFTLEPWLQPVEEAHTLLLNRLRGVSADMVRYMNTCTNARRYEESRRFNSLALSIDASIDGDGVETYLDADLHTTAEERKRGRDRLDYVASLCRDGTDMMLKLRNEEERLRVALHFDEANRMDELANYLSERLRPLRQQIAEYSIEQSEMVMTQLETEGTEAIVPDLILTLPAADKHTILSLVALSATQSIFRSLHEWPGVYYFDARRTMLQLDVPEADMWVVHVETEAVISPSAKDMLVRAAEMTTRLSDMLLPEHVAKTKLVVRLVQLSRDLGQVARDCGLLGQAAEGRRLQAIQHKVSSIFLADETDAPALKYPKNPHLFSLEEQTEGANARGGWRVDIYEDTLKEALIVLAGLTTLKERSTPHAERTPFTNGWAQNDDIFQDDYDAVALAIEDLTDQTEALQFALQKFSFIKQSDLSPVGRALHEGGTVILTADFIFGSLHEIDGQTFASLSLQGAAGEIIRAFKMEMESEGFMALGAQGEGHPIKLRPQAPAKTVCTSLVEEVKEAQATRGLFGAVIEDDESVNEEEKEKELPYVVDFRDAALLCSLGFEVRDLRAAGFSDAALLTAGYPLFELRAGGFRTKGLRIAGMSDIVIRLLGLEGELEHDFLKDFYTSTGGPQWKSRMDFGRLFDGQGEPSADGKSDADVMSLGLGGVELDERGRLIGIAIGNNNLLGEMRNEMTWPAKLEHLRLNHNRLFGSIPNAMGLIENLTSICLHNNELRGEIPATFGFLRTLEVLRLDNNKLEGSIPTTFAGLVNLKRFTASNNRLRGAIPDCLCTLETLQEVILSHNQLSGVLPPAIGNLENMRTLDLGHNRLQGDMPSSMPNCVSLTLFVLEGNLVSCDRLLLQNSLKICKLIL